MCKQTNPDVNQFNLDEDGEDDDTDYSECVNTCQLEDDDEGSDC
jgi:hypothetical protein